MPEASRCQYTIRGVRLGRHVVEQTQCRRRTTHPSGLCFQHRSDRHDEGQDR